MSFVCRFALIVVSQAGSVVSPLRDEWTEAIQMVADKLQRQEEERIQCSPTSNIDNMVEEEMDISTTHHKRKVAWLLSASRANAGVLMVSCFCSCLLDHE